MTTIDTLLQDLDTKRGREAGGLVAALIAAGATAGDLASRAVTAVLDWQDRARERRQLLALCDRALHDFATSRATAAGEADKPFWRE